MTPMYICMCVCTLLDLLRWNSTCFCFLPLTHEALHKCCSPLSNNPLKDHFLLPYTPLLHCRLNLLLKALLFIFSAWRVRLILLTPWPPFPLQATNPPTRKRKDDKRVRLGNKQPKAVKTISECNKLLTNKTNYGMSIYKKLKNPAYIKLETQL